jgi:hypothetical protein
VSKNRIISKTIVIVRRICTRAERIKIISLIDLYDFFKLKSIILNDLTQEFKMSISCDAIKTQFKEKLEEAGYELGPRCYATVGVSVIASCALFIIGCIGAAGILPGSLIGWTAVGLGGAGFLLSLSLGNFEKRKVELITGALLAAVYVTVGALGATGILSATQVGWGIIGSSLAAMPVMGVATYLQRKRRQNQEPGNV